MLQKDPAALGLTRVSERSGEQQGRCWDLGAHAAWSSKPCFCSRFNLDWACGSMLSHIWLWWYMWYLACSEVLSFSDKANWQLWGPAKDVWGCCCATAIGAVPLLAGEDTFWGRFIFCSLYWACCGGELDKRAFSDDGDDGRKRLPWNHNEILSLSLPCTLPSFISEGLNCNPVAINLSAAGTLPRTLGSSWQQTGEDLSNSVVTNWRWCFT